MNSSPNTTATAMGQAMPIARGIGGAVDLRVPAEPPGQHHLQQQQNQRGQQQHVSDVRARSD